MTEYYAYSAGTAPLAASGHMRAFGTRLLLRAIFRKDEQKGALWTPEHTSTDSDCFEIVSVGKGVALACEKMGEDVPLVGQHCEINSVRGDRVGRDLSGRYWLVDVVDMGSIWNRVQKDDVKLLHAIELTNDRAPSYVAPHSNGEVQLESTT